MKGTSITRRELLGLLEAMRSFKEFLADKTVVIYGDNQSAIRILDIGSKRADLQEIAIRIFRFAGEFSIPSYPAGYDDTIYKRRMTVPNSQTNATSVCRKRSF